MRKFPFIIVLLLITSFLNDSQATYAQEISEDYVKKVVSTLASDRMKGRSANRPQDALRAASYIDSLFTSIGLDYYPGLKGYGQSFVGDSVPMANVVGMLKGKSKPDEYVVFSAHYDHIGVLKPIKGDSIANGADDDASGTTAVIALAKYFKELNNNERSLIFVSFTAEELGGYGSEFFTKSADPKQIVAMFNIEMIGKLSKWGPNSAFITGFERSDFGTILQKNVEGTAFKFQPDPYPKQQLFYRSDNARLAMKGVPAHSISTDKIDTDKLYHTAKDEVSSLNIKNMTAVIRAIAMGSKSIVEGKDTPTRLAIPKRGGN